MKGIAAAILALLALLSGCGRQGAQDLSAFAPAEADRLVIYTSHKEEIYSPVIQEFEARTGIWVQVEAGGTGELLERIAAEGADTPCDLLFGGGVESLEACRELFAPYVSPLAAEVAEPFRCGDGIWTPFSSLPVVLIYNPKLVRVNPPTGWASLLSPAWRGQIAFASPEVSGSSYTALAALLQVLPGRWEDTLDAFIHNLWDRTLDGSGAVVQAVADGSCYIGVTLEETALRGIQAGSNIAMVYPSEGTCAPPDGLAVVAGCAHEENARRFIDFALGEDMQRQLVSEFARRSVREDLAAAEDGGFLRFPYEIQQASEMRDEVIARWRRLTEGALS